MPLDLSVPTPELARALCDIPSVSGDEHRLADAVEHALAPFAHLALERDGDAIVARTALGRERRVAIAGHLDTVPVNANLPVVTASIGGREHLVGRGTVDMKSGVAVQLALAARLTEPRCDITWILYDHEEVDAAANGLGRLARRDPSVLAADLAILMEPTSAGIEGGCNGTLRATVTTRGRRAHSARAWRGENAIHAAAPVLARLAAYEPQTRVVDGLDYREGLNAVGIRGGVAGNVIPDECVVEVNYRFAPDRDLAAAERRVREVLDGFALEVVDGAPGARPGLDSELAREFVAAVGAVPTAKHGWTDVARFSAAGTPALNYGPGDPLLAHADDERVPVDEITACERALAAWLAP